jgi:hypothetical protein
MSETQLRETLIATQNEVLRLGGLLRVANTQKADTARMANGLGARVVAAIFAETDRRRAAHEFMTREQLAPTFAAIVEAECRAWVQGHPPTTEKPATGKSTAPHPTLDPECGNRRKIPPLPEWVTAYSAKIGYPMKGELWCDAYAQKGWKVGSKRMVDWQAAVRNWKASGYAPPSFMVGGGSGKAVVGVEVARDYSRI